ncbi:hypothetical protein A9267_10030 [Shewanella sp. UCD-FRSSP16_17]|uniref:restriction endonuclease subunit S n=1 Tax=Shewanella sp. UCD-FRSSP16_17 TaxID=1853256 RepID=UPI0007EEB080|nr:restriction endonuclease subunit S [Shewanella sp. UCD-FRSSP16_17]OBT08055.1 hypothetical protein A9267_10030 [Shewanella sp. UCD-FRSSP16_17]
MSNLVPEGWGTFQLGDVADVRGRIGWKGYKTTDLRDNGPLVIGGTQISKEHKLDFRKPVYLSREKYEESPEIMVHPGDLLLVKTGNTIGKIALVGNIGEACINPNTVIFRIKPPLNQYVYQVFTSEKYQKIIWDFVAVGAQPSVNQANLKSIHFLTPPLPEQQKIAAILTSVDEVIEKTQAQIDKLKDLKTAMMQTLLTNGVGTKHRTGDGESYTPHTEFKDSPVGRIPKSWEVVTLESLVKAEKKITYGIVQAGPHCEGGVPYIRVSDMSSRHLTRKGMLLTSSDIAKKYERSAVCAGDIVYALRGMIGHVHIVPSELEGANLTQGTARISPSEAINTNYLLWAMRSPYLILQNELEAKGSTFKEVTLASLRKMQIAVPSDSEQQFISATLSSIELKIFAVEDKLEQSKSLKKALMQDLLTGKVRVKVD